MIGPARFLTPLDLRKLGERTWLLLAHLEFYSARYQGTVIAPRGLQTNLASIPRLAWVVCPPIGWYDPAAVIHDAAYGNALVTPNGDRIFTIKAVADNLLLEGMDAMHVNPVVRQTMTRLVRWFGNPDGHPLAANRGTRQP